MNGDLEILLTRPPRISVQDWDDIRQDITFMVMDELSAHGIGFSYQGGPLFDERAEIKYPPNPSFEGAA